MTELNHATQTEEPESVEPETDETPAGVSWPSLLSELPEATSREQGTPDAATRSPATQDPAISSLLERLGALPGMPVAGHGEVYAGLHDDLMEALNEDVATGDASS